MNEFRLALEQYATGADRDAAQRGLAAAVAHEPHLAAAMLALVEAYQRGGRLTVQQAQALQSLVRANSAPRAEAAGAEAAGADRTQFRPRVAAAAGTVPASGASPALPLPPPAAGAAAPAVSADRTQFRPRTATDAGEGAMPAAAAPGERTQFRPRPAAQPEAVPAEAPAQPAVESVAAPEKTQFRPRAPADAGAGPATSVTGGTPSQPAPRTGTGTGTGGIGSSGSWSDFNRLAATPSARLTLGSVLKGRYVLESIVAGGDKGGMGVVYKARDLIKEEAQDRNPFVAIKVLNEEFKRHPESVRALQRETRRAQSLQHENIIYVYDFDRDGGNVFMAMELLEGSPINEVIRGARERGGLPTREALRIIQGLGRALAHAHSRNIVHSDFKPSNAFLTRDNIVKVLDFGIARAAKVSGPTQGEKTLFDAGSLGALTMAYASCEQIESKDPDPSDDVYALSLVSYELLTGHHPFERPDPDHGGRLDKTDARTARDARMRPARVKGLTRRQWHTLESGLGFTRERRPLNAAAFLEGLAPRKRPVAAYVSAAAAALVLVAVAIVEVPTYLDRMHQRSVTQQLLAGDTTVMPAALKVLDGLPTETRQLVLASAGVQTRVLDYFEQLYRRSFDPAAGRYEYRTARQALVTAQQKYYPDSQRLARMIDDLDKALNTEHEHQATAFETRLKSGVLLPEQGAENLQPTLEAIKGLDPRDPLLTDPRLPPAYAEQAQRSLDAGNVPLAAKLLAAGLLIAPKNPNLLDLQDRVDRQRAQLQLQAQVSQLEGTLGGLVSAGSLADFRTQRPQLNQLRQAAPNSAVFTAAQRRLSDLVGAVVSTAVQQRQAGGAEAAVQEFADLLPANFVNGQRQIIARALGEAQAREAQLSQLRAAIDTLLQSPHTDDAWIASLRRDLQSLAGLNANDPAIRDAQGRAGQFFVTSAQQLTADKRLSEAQRMLDVARDFGLSGDRYAAQSAAIAQARAELEQANRASAILAQLKADERRFSDLVGADNIDSAKGLLADLQKRLTPGDPFLTGDAPAAIANAYLARVQRSLAQARFDEALRSAQSAQQAAPAQPALQAATAAALQRAQAGREVAVALVTSNDLSSLKPRLDPLSRADPSAYQALKSGLAHVVSQRLTALAQSDPAAAQKLRAAALQLLPGSDLPVIPAPSTRAAPVAVPVTAPPVHTEPSPPPPPPVVATPAPAPGTTTTVPAAAPATGAAPAASAPGPIVVATRGISGRPCTASLAGLGHDPRAYCRDALPNDGHGPDLVVITRADGSGSFAIMRNETSVADYNAYCTATGCTLPGSAGPTLPITSVSEADAEKYAAWLSGVTGARYRLPSEHEWQAAAGSVQGKDVLDANCQVTLNGTVVRGNTLRAVNASSLSTNGLRDVVGNVQEWVKADSGLKAVGGDIGDSIDTCSSQLSRSHSGSPDGRTGFRLVREMP